MTARPVCDRCTKAKLDCTGYQKNVIFMQDWKRRDDRSTASINKSKNTSGWQIQVGPQMTSTGIRRDVYISFLTSKLFSQRKENDMQAWYAFRLKELPTPGLALDALVTYFYGRWNRIYEVTQQGAAYYSKALLRLASDLKGPQAYSEETLMTTVLLTMYELIGYSSNRGWIAHAGGLSHLIQARGPQAHVSGIGKAVFIDQRTLIISQAVLDKKRTFLSKPEWRSIPWKDDPGSKTLFDFLLDITAVGAGYLEEIESISASSPTIDIVGLASQIHSSIDELDDWWRAWATKLIGNVAELPPDPRVNISFDKDGPVFETVLRYADFWSCYVTVCHNSTRIMLLVLLQQIKSIAAERGLDVPERATEASLLPLSGITNDIQALSMDTLRAIEFFEAQSRRFLGAYCLLFPITMIQQCLDPGSREYEWLYNLPGRNLASYRGAAGDQNHSSALPTCGCMMIDSVVANS